MNESFVDILCCPLTGSSLDLVVTEYSDDGNIWSGCLISPGIKHQYPIINGIPRFVIKSSYCKSYDFEWKNWSKVQYESENIGMPMENFTSRFFLRTTGFSDSELSGKLVAEFGCGGGRYMDIALSKGAIVVGIDISKSVDQAYRNLNHYKNKLIVQGDILNPPFKENVFDAAYSIGVLHHTPDPEKALGKLIWTLKPGAFGTALVYAKDSWYDSRVIRLYRKFFNSIRILFGYYPALVYSHISAKVFYHIMPLIQKIPLVGNRMWQIIERNFLVVNTLPDLKWRILDTFDAITPNYASTHSPEEVRSWFEAAGCINIENTNWNKCGWRGQKPGISQNIAS